MEEKYYKFELDVTKMNVIVLLAFIPFGILMFIFSDFFSNTFDNFYIVFSGLILVFLIHELFHGIGYSLFVKDKSKIKYGIALEKGVLYAMCQDVISKPGIIVSLLFPLIFLTLILGIIGILINNSVIVFLAIVNLLGAVGDIMMATLAIRLPKDTKYIDYNADIGAYFISTKDISNMKTIGFKCIESGKHALDKVDNSIKRFTITKGSIPYIIGFIAIIVIDFLVSYFSN